MANPLIFAVSQSGKRLADAMVSNPLVRWVWTGPGNEWTNGSNWNPATVPTGTAEFSNNIGAPTTVNISSNASIQTMDFTAAAPAYSFNVTAGATFAINTGITNASPTLPSFQVNLGSTLTFGDRR